MTILEKLLLAAVFFMFAVIVCPPVKAEGITLMAGASHFTPHEDGVWYQEAFPHKLNMESVSAGVRYDTKVNASSWSYGIGYMNLGKVSSDAQAVALDGRAPNDGGYNSATRACNGECWPLSRWIGQGSVEGVFTSASKHYGPWSVETGAYWYRPKWKVNIPNWRACRNCATQDLTVVHNTHWQVGPMFGVTYKPSKWSVTVSMWHTASEGDEWASLYHNMTYNASVGHTF